MDTPRPHKTLEFLLDNIFDILTILIAAYLVVRNKLEPFAPSDIAQLASWILAVLGLLAVSGLWDRNRRLRRIEKLSEDARNLILRRLSGRVLSADFFASTPLLSEKALASATTIFLAGITLARTSRDYMHVLGQKLRAGAHIRTIIIDPTNSSLMEIMANRSMGNTNASYWQTRMETVTSVIKAIAAVPGSTGKLEIGYLPYIPSFGVVLTDPDQPQGLAFIELYHHRSAEPNPAFSLEAINDPLWYRFFRDQYEILWNSCRVESIGKAGP